MFRSYKELLIHSGNILDMIDIKSKTGITSTEELTDCLKKAFSEGMHVPGEKIMEVYNVTHGSEIVEAKELLTNVKVFLKTPTRGAVKSAINTVKTILYNMSIDSLIIWYPEPMTDEPTQDLLSLWETLGGFVKEKKVGRLGIADIETKVFISLYEKVEVKPEIFHLTVQNCCLVPPDLQKFAEEREIQLLTHYDPPDIFPDDQLSAFSDLKDFKTYWIARYQSHVRCRGVLAKKGYIAFFHQE